MSTERARAIAISRGSVRTGDEPGAVRSLFRAVTIASSLAEIVASSGATTAAAVAGPRSRCAMRAASGEYRETA